MAGFHPPALAEAIRYELARWTALTRFLDDGRIELDNNPVEWHPAHRAGAQKTISWRAQTAGRSMGNRLLLHRHRKAGGKKIRIETRSGICNMAWLGSNDHLTSR